AVPARPSATLFPYTPLFRSRRPRRGVARRHLAGVAETGGQGRRRLAVDHHHLVSLLAQVPGAGHANHARTQDQDAHRLWSRRKVDRKSTRLNSSHVKTSYAV